MVKLQKKMEKGITLVTIVITIVVLLILAGVVINITMRDGGILNKVSAAHTNLKISSVEEKINSELAGMVIENVGKATNQSKIIAELDKKGYTIKSLSSSPEILKGVLIKDSTGKSNDEINVVQGESKTIQIVLDLESSEEKNYIEIDGKHYEITIEKNRATISRSPRIETNATEYSLKLIPNTNGPKLKSGNTEITNEISIVNGTEITIEAGQEIGNNYEFTVKEKSTNIVKNIKINVLQNPKYATSLELKVDKTEVEPGEKAKVTATITAGATDTIDWKISPTSAGTISNQGELVVNANTQPDTKITVTAKCIREDGTISSVPEKTITITVIDASNVSDIVNSTQRTTTKDWATDWSTLSKMADEISNCKNVTSTTTEVKVKINNQKQTIGIGDTATVTLSSATASRATITAGTYKVRIIGFNHDTLANGNKAGISFEFVNVIGNAIFYDSTGAKTNYSGWGGSDLKSVLNSTVLTKLSNKSYIKSVKKEYTKSTNSGKSYTTVSNNYDQLWLMSYWEVYGKKDTNDAQTTGIQYAYYKMNNTAANRIKKDSKNTAKYWWLRSIPTSQNSIFFYISTYGSSGATTYGTTSGCGIAPGFSI